MGVQKKESKGGRPGVSTAQETQIRELFTGSEGGKSLRAIAAEVGVAPGTVSRVLDDAGLRPRAQKVQRPSVGSDKLAMPSARVSIRELARRAGVSPGTASLAMRNSSKLRPETIERVREVAEQIGYEVHPYVSAQLAAVRSGRVKKVQATLAYLHADFSRGKMSWQRALQQPGGPRRFFESCQSAAQSRGYNLEYFPYVEAGRSMKRLRTILKSRGIRGIILDAPAAIVSDTPFDFDGFSTVALRDQNAVRTHVFGHDHFLNTLRSICRLWRMGYRRIGYVINDSISVSTLFSRDAAFAHAQQHLISQDLRIPILNGDTLVEGLLFYFRTGNRPVDRNRQGSFDWLFKQDWSELSGETNDGRVAGKAIFSKWFQDYRPEVVVCEYNGIIDNLKEMGLRVPEDVGLVHNSWGDDVENWTGIKRADEDIGETAVQFLCNMIDLGQVGLPRVPIRQRIEGEWVERETTRSIDQPLTPYTDQADRFIRRALGEPVSIYPYDGGCV